MNKQSLAAFTPWVDRRGIQSAMVKTSKEGFDSNSVYSNTVKDVTINVTGRHFPRKGEISH